MQERYRQINRDGVFEAAVFVAVGQYAADDGDGSSERKAERGMLLAPMSERIRSEWLNAVVRRELDIIASYGLLDDVPDELAYDGAMAIEFESPAVHLQDAGKVAGMYQTIEGLCRWRRLRPMWWMLLDADVNACGHWRNTATRRQKSSARRRKLPKSGRQRLRRWKRQQAA